MENLTSNDPNDPSCVYKHKTPSPAGSEVGTLPLPDLSNIKARPKRQASKNAETTMSKVLKMHAPRGDPSKSTPSRMHNLKQKQAAKQMKTAGQNTTEDDTLQSILKNKHEAFQMGADAVHNFVSDSLSWETSKGLAIHMLSALIQTGKKINEASQLTSIVTGFSMETVRRWGTSFYQAAAHKGDNEFNLEWVEECLVSSRGCHPKTISLFEDEDFQLQSKEFVRKNACVKGSPNLTAKAYATWIATNWKHTVSERTAIRWLHKLGFKQQRLGKAVYFDGHERSDVLADRKKYVDKLHEYDYPEPDERPIIRIYHDESTFYANSEEKFFWADGSNVPIRSKSLGQAIMVSDFIEEKDGYLENGNDKARVYLEHSKEGYWNNERLLKQVDKAMDIFEAKYPDACGLFLFDNAPSHRKVANDALNAAAMNVNSGGSQPVMRDTEWNGSIQKMVNENGEPKGLRIVLQERGVDTSSMTKDQMCKALLTYPDFKTAAKPLLQERIEARNHKCMFIPRFHCELNPIEWVWCFVKRHTQKYSNGTITRLRQILPPAFDNVLKDLIKKFFRKVRDYEMSYRLGCTATNVDEAVKTYSSHRRISQQNLLDKDIS
jgi:hypothetical protein